MTLPHASVLWMIEPRDSNRSFRSPGLETSRSSVLWTGSLENIENARKDGPKASRAAKEEVLGVVASRSTHVQRILRPRPDLQDGPQSDPRSTLGTKLQDQKLVGVLVSSPQLFKFSGSPHQMPRLRPKAIVQGLGAQP